MEKITWSTLTGLMLDEVAAKGLQLKSMLGIADNTPITAKQLKYLKDNYVRLSGVDNMMQQLLNSITDFDAAAGWFNRNPFDASGILNDPTAWTLFADAERPKGKWLEGKCIMGL